jgi:hypothetical protein
MSKPRDHHAHEKAVAAEALAEAAEATPDTPPAAPPVATGPDLAAELEKLRRENAVLRQNARTYTPPTGPPGRYRVFLPGCKVRTVDDAGRPRMQDHLDVDGTSPGDAFEKFKQHNGILSTVQVPRIEPLPADEAEALAGTAAAER